MGKVSQYAVRYNQGEVILHNNFTVACRVVMDFKSRKDDCEEAAQRFSTGDTVRCHVALNTVPEWPLSRSIVDGGRDCYQTKNHELDSYYKTAQILLICGCIAFALGVALCPVATNTFRKERACLRQEQLKMVGAVHV
mmetsp:Transcript_9111/g.23859  ORF Transcript_9111/g.23859 Transcript_9111/m.23859 type:complete len:138 (+) Transcript_9111:98-511(+)|eukprot:CAMPEP_0115866290 /NCGR_PEP_ID=MMETSP0287-20121206/20172_1 /TAXON_ID=412157 /ORGANISM="Chrysochromulina rotalis, Strain UIO044" /LENGTH=137 /DNA_ID=CAMNT_0003320851 /DNA_START=104 /DNA_END=517 /DNA_ORIENTATION=+